MEPGERPATPDAQAAWRCTDQLDYFEEGSTAVFFATCEPVAVDGSAAISDPPGPTIPVTGTVLDVTATTMPITDQTTIAPASPTTTIVYCEQADGGNGRVTVPCDTVGATDRSGPPTSVAFDPAFDDPVYSPVPACSPGNGAGVECALTDEEQQHTVVPGDTVESIAGRYRLSVGTLAAWNDWPGRSATELEVGDLARIPPWSAVQPPATTAPIETAP